MAQPNTKIYGNWVKTRVTYKDGTELTDDNELKYDYLRYSFSKPDKALIAMIYNRGNHGLTYTITSGILQIKSTFGFVMNEFFIEKLTDKELILIQKGNAGFDGPDCLRYYYITEDAYQRSIPLTINDIVSISGKDTVYKASAKIYASYKGEIGFHELVSKAVDGLRDAQPLNNHFLATFIVNKTGEADSLHIVEGINPDFDKRFIKTFNKLKKNWIPATYNGNVVNVQMVDEFKFVPSEKYNIYDRFLKLGNAAMNQGEYAVAVFNFGKALDSYAAGDVYYKRALCQSILGNKDEACKDLKTSEALGYSAATGLMAKMCH
jgi:tetratricopeptide (TPR) repeat protein